MHSFAYDFLSYEFEHPAIFIFSDRVQRMSVQWKRPCADFLDRPLACECDRNAKQAAPLDYAHGAGNASVRAGISR